MENKTVVDAVNYYHGQNSWDRIVFREDKFECCDFGEWMQYSVCTKEEFEQCVKEMAKDPRNNGESWTYDWYKRDFKNLNNHEILESIKEPEVERSNEVADDAFMLQQANQHIEKLNAELKEKEGAIIEHVRRWQFYEQIVRNLTTFR